MIRRLRLRSIFLGTATLSSTLIGVSLGCGVDSHGVDADVEPMDAGPTEDADSDSSGGDAAPDADTEPDAGAVPITTCEQLYEVSSRCIEEFPDCPSYEEGSISSGCELTTYLTCMGRWHCEFWRCDPAHREWTDCVEAYCMREDWPPECGTPPDA